MSEQWSDIRVDGEWRKQLGKMGSHCVVQNIMSILMWVRLWRLLHQVNFLPLRFISFRSRSSKADLKGPIN